MVHPCWNLNVSVNIRWPHCCWIWYPQCRPDITCHLLIKGAHVGYLTCSWMSSDSGMVLSQKGNKWQILYIHILKMCHWGCSCYLLYVRGGGEETTNSINSSSCVIANELKSESYVLNTQEGYFSHLYSLLFCWFLLVLIFCFFSCSSINNRDAWHSLSWHPREPLKKCLSNVENIPWQLDIEKYDIS